MALENILEGRLENKMAKISDDYLKAYCEMEQAFLNKSNGMSLKEIIVEIQRDKDFIFNFIKHPTILELTKNICGLYKFNKDEVLDIVAFAITEFFYLNPIDLDNFDEEMFLMDLRKNVGTVVQRHIRQGYSGKEYPSSNWLRYENCIIKEFDEDQIIEKVDVENAIKSLTGRERKVLELYYINKYTQQEIANMLDLSKTYINNILVRVKHHLKKNLEFY